MKTLIIYDNTGVIYIQITSGYIIPQGGVNFLEVEIPESRYIKCIDVTVTPNIPVYENIPETLEQNIKNLKNDNELLKGCVMEIADMVYASTTATKSGV